MGETVTEKGNIPPFQRGDEETTGYMSAGKGNIPPFQRGDEETTGQTATGKAIQMRWTDAASVSIRHEGLKPPAPIRYTSIKRTTMKLLIASDIHGAASWCSRLVSAIAREQPDRVLLLGDILYHGPRNDIPDDYDPKRVIELLSPFAEHIIAVRGNCEAEVDQMVLPFPCMASYTIIFDATTTRDARELFCTHGHIYGAGRDNSVDNMPPLPPGTTLVYGHTHIKANEESLTHPGIWLYNPGSVGIPKDGTHSYGIYHNGIFEHRLLQM